MHKHAVPIAEAVANLMTQATTTEKKTVREEEEGGKNAFLRKNFEGFPQHWCMRWCWRLASGIDSPVLLNKE